MMSYLTKYAAQSLTSLFLPPAVLFGRSLPTPWESPSWKPVPRTPPTWSKPSWPWLPRSRREWAPAPQPEVPRSPMWSWRLALRSSLRQAAAAEGKAREPRRERGGGGCLVLALCAGPSSSSAGLLSWPALPALHPKLHHHGPSPAPQPATTDRKDESTHNIVYVRARWSCLHLYCI